MEDLGWAAACLLMPAKSEEVPANTLTLFCGRVMCESLKGLLGLDLELLGPRGCSGFGIDHWVVPAAHSCCTDIAGTPSQHMQKTKPPQSVHPVSLSRTGRGKVMHGEL